MGLGESSIWDATIPSLRYTSTSISKVLSDIEDYSRKSDPSGTGIRIVWPNTYWASTNGVISLNITNYSIGDSVQLIAELSDFHVAFGERTAYFCASPISGPPIYRRAGVLGRISDAANDAPITNASFITYPSITNIVHIDSSGKFVGAIDYLVRRPQHDYMRIYRAKDDHFEVDVTAPGYCTQEIMVKNGDNELDNILIKLKKCQHVPPEGRGAAPRP